MKSPQFPQPEIPPPKYLTKDFDNMQVNLKSMTKTREVEDAIVIQDKLQVLREV